MNLFVEIKWIIVVFVLLQFTFDMRSFQSQNLNWSNFYFQFIEHFNCLQIVIWTFKVQFYWTTTQYSQFCKEFILWPDKN